METVQGAVRTITSRETKRAFVNAILLSAGAAALFFLATIASALFFQNFVPDKVLSVPVYLQYGSGPHPYGVASLTSPWLKSAQDYDVSVRLSVPPSPPNVDRGNFMVTLHLLDQDVRPSLLHAAQKFSQQHHRLDGYDILFSSRRPALVPYIDPIVSVASRVIFLFYHMLIPSSRTHEVTVPLAEKMSFTKGYSVPAAAYVEVEAGQDFQTYQVWLVFTAQLRGLRWLMHNYRLPTYVAFTFLFWACELTCMGLVWALWFSRSPSEYEGKLITRDDNGLDTQTRLDDSEEGEDDSDDTAYGKQEKLEPGVKDEERFEGRLSDIPMGGGDSGEDDAEEEDDGTYDDAGVGTSYREEGGGQVRRRASRQGGS